MSETNFVNIEDVLDLHKGNFKGTCISQSELKAGTGASGDWTRKFFTLEDRTGKIEITAWGEEINFFKVGLFYEIENPWWKEYEGKWSCNLGKYCKVKAVNPPVDVKPAVETAEEEIQPEPKGPRSVNGDKLPPMIENAKMKVTAETLTLLQIEAEVIATMELFQPRLSLEGSKIGMFVKEIYRRMNNVEFKKASVEKED